MPGSACRTHRNAVDAYTAAEQQNTASAASASSSGLLSLASRFASCSQLLLRRRRRSEAPALAFAVAGLRRPIGSGALHSLRGVRQLMGTAGSIRFSVAPSHEKMALHRLVSSSFSARL